MINKLRDKWKRLDTRMQDFIVASPFLFLIFLDSSNFSKPISPNFSQINVLLLLPIVFIEGVVYWDMFKLLANELMHVWLLLFPPKNFEFDKHQKKIISKYLDDILSNFDRPDHQFILACIIDKSPMNKEVRYSKYSKLIKSKYLPMFYKIDRHRSKLPRNDVEIAIEHKILSKDFWINFNISNKEEFEQDLISSPETEYTYILSSDKYTVAIGFYLKLSLEFDGYTGEEIRETRKTIAKSKIKTSKNIIKSMIKEIDEMIHNK